MKIDIKCPNCGRYIKEELNSIGDIEEGDEMELNCPECKEFIQFSMYKRTDLHFYYSSTGYADFPDDNYLCLVLKSDIGAIFTTLRKDNEENREKYMILKSAGIAGLYQEPRYKRQFNIIIKED